MGNPDESELQPTIPVEQVDDSAPPDGGYGWVVAFAMWLVNGGTWGVSSPMEAMADGVTLIKIAVRIAVLVFRLTFSRS